MNVISNYRFAAALFTAVSAVAAACPPEGWNGNGDWQTDTRDGRKYRTVKIGGKTWMAENLNYMAGKSLCYGDSAYNCDKYGRLYNWDMADDVCPSKWHLPTRQEWVILALTVGEQRYYHQRKDYNLLGWYRAGRMLKAASGWIGGLHVSASGIDAHGFSALPGGEHFVNEFRDEFESVGKAGLWWTADSDAHRLDYHKCSYMAFHSDFVMDDLCGENMGLSMRCVKDGP